MEKQDLSLQADEQADSLQDSAIFRNHRDHQSKYTFNLFLIQADIKNKEDPNFNPTCDEEYQEAELHEEYRERKKRRKNRLDQTARRHTVSVFVVQGISSEPFSQGLASSEEEKKIKQME